MMNKHLTARSPGKLILSGEHAVVYGKPALAMAVNRYAESKISTHFSPAIFFNLLNLRYAKSLTLNTLTILKARLQENYNEFLQGQCSIRDVLKKPFELLQYTVSSVIEKLNMTLPHGVEIKTSSTIPMGCGMGSSAATVMSTLHALTHFFKLEFEASHYLHLAKEAENLQHGRSSGLDLQLALQGGCLKFQAGKTELRELANLKIYIIQTGMPQSSTGECVSEVASLLQTGTLVEDFASITQEMDISLQSANNNQIQDCVRANHALLCTLGVVPTKVQTFIQALEKLGAAAKICGAGSVKGDNAGVIWVIFKEDENPYLNVDVQTLLKTYGYTLEALEIDRGGSCLV